jgi:hypothetical protein
MATEQQIESAARAAKPSSLGDGFVEHQSQHVLGGAFILYEESEARRAARLLDREAPGTAGSVGLGVAQRPAPTVAAMLGTVLVDDLLGLVQRGRDDDARAMLSGLSRLEAEALREALRARREDR